MVWCVFIKGKRASQEDACMEDKGKSGTVVMLHCLFEVSENNHPCRWILSIAGINSDLKKEKVLLNISLHV